MQNSISLTKITQDSIWIGQCAWDSMFVHPRQLVCGSRYIWNRYKINLFCSTDNSNGISFLFIQTASMIACLKIRTPSPNFGMGKILNNRRLVLKLSSLLNGDFIFVSNSIYKYNIISVIQEFQTYGMCPN